MKSYKVRLYPNNKQRTLMNKSAGVARWVYNWVLEQEQKQYEIDKTFIDNYTLRKQLTQLKKQEGYKWIGEVSVNVVKQSVKDACNAYHKFFKKTSKYPRFKSKKKSKQSFYNDLLNVKFVDSKVRIEKIGWVNMAEANRIPKGVKYYNPRITFNGLFWSISISVEEEITESNLKDETIGIDIGIKNTITLNDGTVYQNINKLKRVKTLNKRIKRLQKQVSRKYEKNKVGNKYNKTSNIKKLEHSLRKARFKVTEIQKDYLHKMTTQIVNREPRLIIMEDLLVSGMLKNKRLARAIQEQSFRQMRTLIEDKAKKKGIVVVVADRFYPSSKTCSVCGLVKTDLKLKDRLYKCECGNILDRDINAAINLSRYCELHRNLSPLSSIPKTLQSNVGTMTREENINVEKHLISFS